MLNISGLENGVVIDHIPAGVSMEIYKYLKLKNVDDEVAIIKNAQSGKMGKKDIIKISGDTSSLDIDAVGFFYPDITVNVIKDGKIIEKKRPGLPKKLVNIIKCKNPRCITSIEQELPQIFELTDAEHAVYRCQYCEEKYTK
ncbi:MAG: aspartate carbamoyltransferase regulatory subunit [Lachnospiraceae bacterium]|nr:aspartate carbamoyltransferase regulatory subunit [Lachnospiraceae bacterium]